MFKKKKEEKSEMEQLEEMEQEVKKRKEALVKEHGENVEADVQDLNVGPDDAPEPPEGMVRIPNDLKETIDVLQKSVGQIYQSQPVDQSIVQRDEMNTLLLAMFHELRQIRKELHKR